jgi:amidophosphoribosyltransferase
MDTTARVSGDADQAADDHLDLDADKLREECGVFGIFGHPDAAAITALGLHALQHRGQEAAGIVSFDGQRFHSERRLGLVGDTFSRREVIDRLPGSSAVGHVRYSTTGETILRNVQPLFAELNAGGFAVAHNGNLTNGLTLRRELVRGGAMMQSTTLSHNRDAITSSTATSRRCARSRAPTRWSRSPTRNWSAPATRSASARLCSATSTAARSSPRRPARSTSSAPSMSATSSMAK